MSGKPVYRLLDMEVEEISLVDRAANKQRFLIVKRSDMNETEEEQESGGEQTTGDEADDGDDDGDEGDTDVEVGEEGGDEEVEERESPPANSGVAGAAVDALAKLTDLVEKLQKGGTVAKTKDELRAIAESLAKAVGARKPPKRKPPVPPPDEEEDEDEEEIDKSTMAEVRAAFSRVQELLAGRGKRPGSAKPRKRTTKRASGAVPTQTTTKLDEILAKLGTLTTANKEQAQRVSRLEKQAGLPNSAPVGEQPPGDDDDASVLWSLDLNKPTEREQVDKATSFY